MSDNIRLNLYCDEIKESTIKHSLSQNEKWIYIGILIVPCKIEDKLINKLLEQRCTETDDWRTCEKRGNCDYHKKNNREVHYQKLNTADKFHIAKRWIENFFLKDLKQDSPLTYSYILGINLTNLSYDYFGDQTGYERFSTIYNRFFRMGIKKSIKSYFHNYSQIIINNIFHDNSGLKDDNLFPWHSIYKLKQDEKIQVNKNKITFLDSNHKESEDERSNLIQYIDLILGLSFNALHFNTESDKEIKDEIQEKKSQLTLTFNDEILSRLMDNPDNFNSRYNYVKRLSIDFFPKHDINDLSELEKKALSHDGFYKSRERRIKRFDKPLLFNY